jgi:uncharacterized tellurite resistance protein B-like protein
MIESIFGWLTGAAPDAAVRDELQLALAALLVEAAYSDERFDDAERAVVARLLERRFDLGEAGARALLAAGEREAERSAELFRFTRLVNERLSHERRVELIEMLWEVAYADGVLDKYEDSLLRRVGGLVYVSDQERGLARQRVVAQRLVAERPVVKHGATCGTTHSGAAPDRTIRSPAQEPPVEFQEKKPSP